MWPAMHRVSFGSMESPLEEMNFLGKVLAGLPLGELLSGSKDLYYFERVNAYITLFFSDSLSEQFLSEVAEYPTAYRIPDLSHMEDPGTWLGRKRISRSEKIVRAVIGRHRYRQMTGYRLERERGRFNKSRAFELVLSKGLCLGFYISRDMVEFCRRAARFGLLSLWEIYNIACVISKCSKPKINARLPYFLSSAAAYIMDSFIGDRESANLQSWAEMYSGALFSGT